MDSAARARALSGAREGAMRAHDARAESGTETLACVGARAGGANDMGLERVAECGVTTRREWTDHGCVGVLSFEIIFQPRTFGFDAHVVDSDG